MRVLFYQHEDLKQNDVIIVDGVLKSSVEASSSMKTLLNVAEQALSKSEPWAGNIGDYHFVKGFLAQKDELGRRMTFMYLLPFSAVEKAGVKQLLAKDLALTGKSIADDTAAALEAYTLKPNNKMILVGVATVAILLAITGLYMLLSGDNNVQRDSDVQRDSMETLK